MFEQILYIFYYKIILLHYVLKCITILNTFNTFFTVFHNTVNLVTIVTLLKQNTNNHQNEVKMLQNDY